MGDKDWVPDAQRIKSLTVLVSEKLENVPLDEDGSIGCKIESKPPTDPVWDNRTTVSSYVLTAAVFTLLYPFHQYLPLVFPSITLGWRTASFHFILSCAVSFFTGFVTKGSKRVFMLALVLLFISSILHHFYLGGFLESGFAFLNALVPSIMAILTRRNLSVIFTWLGLYIISLALATLWETTVDHPAINSISIVPVILIWHSLTQLGLMFQLWTSITKYNDREYQLLTEHSELHDKVAELSGQLEMELDSSPASDMEPEGGESAISMPKEKSLEIITRLAARPEFANFASDLTYLEASLRATSTRTPEVLAHRIDKDTLRWLSTELKVAVKGKGLSRRESPSLMTPPGTPRRGSSPTGSRSSLDMYREILSTMDEWDMDIFKLAELTQNRPLSILAQGLFHKHNLFRRLKIDEIVFENFVVKVEDNYPQNAYHNSTHAANVLHDVHYFLLQGMMFQRLSAIQLFSVFFAAIIHDVGHQGLNNPFHVRARTPLSFQFSDKSVLEHHHLAVGFSIAFSEGCEIFRSFSAERYEASRKLIISCVLATDMSQHFTLVSDLQGLVGPFHETPEKRGGEDRRKTESPAQISYKKASWESFLSKHEATILSCVLHSADIGHACKCWLAHQRWSANIFHEFITQGDLERELGIDVSPFMDRTKTNLDGSQQHFFNFIVLPWFQHFSALYLVCGEVDNRSESSPNTLSSKNNCLKEICAQAERNKCSWELRVKASSESGSKDNSSDLVSEDSLQQSANIQRFYLDLLREKNTGVVIPTTALLSTGSSTDVIRHQQTLPADKSLPSPLRLKLPHHLSLKLNRAKETSSTPASCPPAAMSASFAFLSPQKVSRSAPEKRMYHTQWKGEITTSDRRSEASTEEASISPGPVLSTSPGETHFEDFAESLMPSSFIRKRHTALQ